MKIHFLNRFNAVRENNPSLLCDTLFLCRLSRSRFRRKMVRDDRKKLQNSFEWNKLFRPTIQSTLFSIKEFIHSCLFLNKSGFLLSLHKKFSQRKFNFTLK